MIFKLGLQEAGPCFLFSLRCVGLVPHPADPGKPTAVVGRYRVWVGQEAFAGIRSSHIKYIYLHASVNLLR